MRLPFLTSPGSWVRSARVSESPRDYACAISGPRKRKHHPSDYVIAALLVVFVVLVAWGIV